MWIYLGALLLVLLPLLAGAATLKQRLAVADRSMRDRICEGGTIRGAHRAVQQIADAHIDIVTYLLTVGLAFLYPVGVLKLQQTLTGSEPNSVIPLMFAAAVLIWSASRLHQSLRNVGRLKAALVAQLEVAVHIEPLMQQGYYVIHDVPGDGFFIDQVVVGRNGVFVISVDSRYQPKGRGARRRVEFEDGRLSYPQGEDTSAIIEARGRSVWLGTWLGRRLGRSCHPTPVLCLPGWHVELKNTPTFPILNQKYLGWTLPGWQGESLEPAEVQRICGLLRQHCYADPEEELAEAA